MDLTCPQCHNKIVDATLRLVQDSCGHKKCRVCLLVDEHECKLCVADAEKRDEIIRLEASEKNIQTQEHIHSTLFQLETVITDAKILQIEDDIHPTIMRKSNQFETEVMDVVDEAVIIDKDTDALAEISEHAQERGPNTSTRKRPYSTCVTPAHINFDDTKYTCTICTRSFTSKGYIKYHKYCANGGKRPYQCKTCPKSFINLSQLEVHELIHSNKKPFSCDICNKSFRQRSKLTRHRLLHNDRRSYICQKCSKPFKTKESLTSHSATHSIDKPFTCNVCDAKFNNSSNYRKHLVIHTKEKPHMCDQCGKRFKLKWSLTVHRKCHSTLRPFRCTHCTKVFSYAKDLHRHELIHLDSKSYICGSCSVEFRRKDNLERHMRNLHPGKKVAPIKKAPIKILLQPPPPIILPPEVPTLPLPNREMAPRTIICTTVAATPLMRRLDDVVRDQPNAVTVIRAPPGVLQRMREAAVATGVTGGEVGEGREMVNAPLKLALKTDEFKSHYNIQRNYVEPELDSSSHPSIPTETKTEERKASLTSYTAPPAGIHYETSFDQEKHAIIKNIKFKLPAKYTNLKSKTIDSPAYHRSNFECTSQEDINDIPKPVYMDLSQRFAHVTAATSVIVNTSENLHWRRRTSQNLNARLLD